MIYGTASIVPLIGGSGGSANANATQGSGGAGGGAILIASSGNIFLPEPLGGISAKGGNASFGGANEAGSGSGGGIRLVANQVSGSGLWTSLLLSM